MYQAAPGASQGWGNAQHHSISPVGHLDPGSYHQHSASGDAIARGHMQIITRVHSAPYAVGALFV